MAATASVFPANPITLQAKPPCGTESEKTKRECLQVAWRTAAEAALVSELNAYLAAIADTLGSRQQAKLTRDQALFIAGCNAVHRDISLNF